MNEEKMLTKIELQANFLRQKDEMLRNRYEAMQHLSKENKQLKEQLQQRDEVIEEISNIINKHIYTQKDDYYDYCEQGISITDMDDDYDKLLDNLNKYKDKE